MISNVPHNQVLNARPLSENMVANERRMSDNLGMIAVSYLFERNRQFLANVRSAGYASQTAGLGLTAGSGVAMSLICPYSLVLTAISGASLPVSYGAAARNRNSAEEHRHSKHLFRTILKAHLGEEGFKEVQELRYSKKHLWRLVEIFRQRGLPTGEIEDYIEEHFSRRSHETSHQPPLDTQGLLAAGSVRV